MCEERREGNAHGKAPRSRAAGDWGLGLGLLNCSLGGLYLPAPKTQDPEPRTWTLARPYRDPYLRSVLRTTGDFRFLSLPGMFSVFGGLFLFGS